MVTTGVATSSSSVLPIGSAGLTTSTLRSATPLRVGHDQSRGIRFAFVFDAEIAGIPNHAGRGVKRPGWVDEKTGPVNIAMLVLGVNLNDRATVAVVNVFYFLGD